MRSRRRRVSPMSGDGSPVVGVILPAQLRAFVGGASRVELRADSVGAALRGLAERSPQLRTRLYADDGSLREYVNVFVGGDEVRELEGMRTRLEDGAELSIVPSIAGG